MKGLTMKTVHTLRVVDARRKNHPAIAGVEKHYFTIKAVDVPSGLRLDCNPRDAKGRDLNRRVYRQVRDSLFAKTAQSGTFDLMNNGITCIAAGVKKISDQHYELTLDDGQGIADGGHTYQLLCENAKDPTLPVEQHVEFRVITGLPETLVPDIAKGLNTGMQVKDYTIENLKGSFEWLKEEISDEPYAGLFAWRENDDNEYDVGDLVCVLECLNVDDYPNQGSKHPYSAYEKSSAALKSFAEDAERTGGNKYKAYRPILKEALTLYDRIRFDFRNIHNRAGGVAGNLKIMDEARGRDKKFTFPFAAGLPKDQYRLNNGAAMPILAAFRNLVVKDDKTGNAKWMAHFDVVLDIWEKVGPDLVALTVQATKEHGRSPNQIGKARSHWSLLHLTLERRVRDLGVV